MATISTFTPDPAYTIYTSTGVPFSQTFDYFYSDDFGGSPQDIAIVSSAGGSLVLPGGATVIPGILIAAGTYPAPVGPLNGVTIAGTPTLAGTYSVYVRARYLVGATLYNNYTVYTVVVSGSALSLSPDNSSEITTGLTSNSYISAPFTISNGSGAYKITANGLPPGLGLSRNPVVPATVSKGLVLTGNTFYIVGTPTLSGVYSNIQFIINDTTTAQSLVTLLYTLTVDNASSGTLTLSKTSQSPITLKQEESAQIIYDATGGSGAYTWDLSGSLPTGLVFTQVGNQTVIAGIPTVYGTYTGSSLGARTGDNVAGTLALTFQIEPNVVIRGDVPSTATVGTPYTGSLTIAGGDGNSSFDFEVVGVKPAWLTITRSGGTLNFTGTPDTNGTSTFSIRAASSLVSGGTIYSSEKQVTIVTSGSTVTGNYIVASKGTPITPDVNGNYSFDINQYSSIDNTFDITVDFSGVSPNSQIDTLCFYGTSFYTSTISRNSINFRTATLPYLVSDGLVGGQRWVIQSYNDTTKILTIKAYYGGNNLYSYPSSVTNNSIYLGAWAGSGQIPNGGIQISPVISPEIRYISSGGCVTAINENARTMTLTAATFGVAYSYAFDFHMPDAGGEYTGDGTAHNQNWMSASASGFPGFGWTVTYNNGTKHANFVLSGIPSTVGTFTDAVTFIQRNSSGNVIYQKTYNMTLTINSAGGGGGGGQITPYIPHYATAKGHPTYGGNSIEFKTIAGGTYYVRVEVKQSLTPGNPAFNSTIIRDGSNYVASTEINDGPTYYRVYGPMSQDKWYTAEIKPTEYITLGYSYPFTLPFKLSTNNTDFTGTSNFDVRFYDEAGPTNQIDFSGGGLFSIQNVGLFLYDGSSVNVRGEVTGGSWVSMAGAKAGNWKLTGSGSLTPNGDGSTTAIYYSPTPSVSSNIGRPTIEYNAYESNYISGGGVTSGYAAGYLVTLPRTDPNFNLTCPNVDCLFTATTVGDTFIITPTGSTTGYTYQYSSYSDLSAYPWLVIESNPSNTTQCRLRVGDVLSAVNQNFIFYLKATRTSTSGTVDVTTKVVQVSAALTPGPSVTGIGPNTHLVNGAFTATVYGTGFQAGDKIRFKVSGNAYYEEYTPDTLNATTITIPVNDPTDWAGPVNQGNIDVQLVRAGNVIATHSNLFVWTWPGALVVTSVSPNVITALASPIDRVITVTGTGFNSNCVVLYDPKDVIGNRITLVTSYQNGNLVATIPSSYLGVDDISDVNRINVKDNITNAVTVSSVTLSIVPSAVTISTSSLPEATIGTPYSTTLAATGGVSPYHNWTVTPTLPDGLSFNTATGAITGTPTVNAVTRNLTFTVQDSSPSPQTSAAKTLTLSVAGGGTVTILTSSVPQATIGQAYSTELQASGGVLPYTWSVTSGALPAGLELSSTGILSGTPIESNTVGNYTFTVRVADSTSPAALTATTAYTLILNQGIGTVLISDFTPKTGPVDGGTPVTITGSGFVGGFGQISSSVVYFGNNVARNIQILNGGTTITCVTPAATSQVNPLDLVVYIRVVNPDGGQITSAATFEYTIQSVPNILSIDKQDGPYAGGQSVIIYGTNFSSDIAVKFGTELNTALSATVTSVDLQANPQKIYATTPTWSYSHDNLAKVDVNVYAQNSNGIGVLPAGDTGYTYRAAPVITGIIPASGPSTGGNTVYILGRYFFQRGNSKPRVFIGNVEVPAENIILVEQ